jgi:hypothetical protein
MNKQIKQSILSGLAFSGTVLFSYLWFAAWTDLPTQTNWDTLNSTIWNNLVTTVNNIWKNQLWVDQSRQNMELSNTSSPNYRVAWATYTNNTWKPIIVSVFSVIDTNTKTFSLTVSWIIVSSNAMTSWYNSRVQCIW